MSQRVHLKLSEIVLNPEVEVTLRHISVVEPEGIENGDTALVAVVSAYGVEFMFDASVHGGEIHLEMSFNAWSPNFFDKYKFVASLGCSFTVC